MKGKIGIHYISCPFFNMWKLQEQVAVATLSKALTVFDRSNTVIMGPNPIWFINVPPRFIFCVVL
jgi:hypothetical protein